MAEKKEKELRIYKITDAGPKDNEDSCYVVQHGSCAALACMADGVSSQSSARHTSAFITEYVEDWYEEEGDRLFSSPAEEVTKEMIALVGDIHNDILAEAEANPGQRYGSTMDLVIMGHRKMFVAHVGDSRVYLYDGTDFQKITEDQTVEEAEKTTGFTFNDVEERRKSHTLMQCMGAGEITPCKYEVDIPASCDIILCTDGLSNRLKAPDFMKELKKKQTGSEALLALVRKARSRGESDNITAILIRRRETRKGGAGRNDRK